MMSELLSVGLLHDDVKTILGDGLSEFCREPHADDGAIRWGAAASKSLDEDVLRPVSNPFAEEGGLRLVEGNLGRAIIKASAVDPSHHSIKAPAKVFSSQPAFIDAFNNEELEQDFVAVMTYQGPRANGMPELHKLTPYLGVLQNRGFKVALVTDGRMSGASGKILAAIQVTPEALCGGLIGNILDGDMITVDVNSGTLSVDGDDIADRQVDAEVQPNYGLGRELFGVFRDRAGPAESGASLFSGEQ